MTNQFHRDSDAGSRSFDWAATHRRLAAIEASVAAEARSDPRAEQELLVRRAAALAAPERRDDRGEIGAFVGFALAGEHYAVPVDQVQEVVDSPQLLTLPGGADLLLGIFNYRGAVVAAIRLVRLIGGDAEENGRFMIVVAADGAWIGIPADDVAGILQIPIKEIRPVSVEPGGDTHPAMRGLTDDSRVVLDAAYLVGDSRLIVDEEVQMPLQGGKGEGDVA
ncbi:MAG: chemotaxis protein CheW [Alphaproteobacteria bacterium]